MQEEQVEKIKTKIDEILKADNIELVEFKLFFSNRKYTVRALACHRDRGITVDECASLNRKIFSFIDDNNLLGDNFIVEVNSPGIDRPLKNYNDFLRVKGKKISLWLNSSFNNNEYYEGVLSNVTEKSLQLDLKDKILEIDFNYVKVGKEKLEF